jgi:hypothetical protein
MVESASGPPKSWAMDEQVTRDAGNDVLAPKAAVRAFSEITVSPFAGGIVPVNNACMAEAIRLDARRWV